MNNKKTPEKTLSEEEFLKIKDSISELLAIDRHFLMFDFPFTASIAMRMNLIPTRDKRNLTAYTDGKNIFFDCDFYLKLTTPERRFVLAHEIWHCVMLHLSRCQTRDKRLFNIAADMEVNQLLADNCPADSDIAPPKRVLFPPTKLVGKSAEVIYEYLLNQAKKNKKSSDDSGADNNNSIGDGSDSDGGKSQSEDGKHTGKLTGQFDNHIYDDNIVENEEEDAVYDQWGEVGYDEDFKPSVSKDFAEKMREYVTISAQQCERIKGSLPAGVKSILDKIHKPEINWREYLNKFVSSCYNGSRRWLPPNRRHVYNDMYFQSRRNEFIDGVVAIDTSGSCIGDLPKFFGELKGLVESFGGYNLTVICADAAVDQVDHYSSTDNPLDFDTDEISWSGGGGTDYGPVFKYIEKEHITPNFLIYIGDGFAGMSYHKKPNYPVMWLLTKDGNENFCDWGKKIKFKNSSYNY